MHLVSCTNIHYDVTDLVNQGMVKIPKLEYTESGTYFYVINNFLICASDNTFWEVIVL